MMSSFATKYRCLNINIKPKWANWNIEEILHSIDWLSCDSDLETVQDEFPNESYETHLKIINNRHKAIDFYWHQYYIITYRKKIINGIIKLQRKYKSYLYHINSNYFKKILKDGNIRLILFKN